MKKIIFILLILLMSNSIFGEDKVSREEVPVFTDEELEKYKQPSDSSILPDKPESFDDGTMTRKALPDVEGEKSTLKRHEVPYTAFEGAARRIIIPVTFNGSVSASMALDTGSPGMIISNKLADKLGLFESNDGKLMTFAAGIGGSVPAILTVIDTVQVNGAQDHFIPTIITESVTEAFEGLIGMDFMANYSIKIDTIRQVVVFEEIPQRPNMPAGHDELWWRVYFRRFASLRAEWKKYKESISVYNGDPEMLEELREFAERQYREADKLFLKLNSYAIKHAVPMTWRDY